jgi:hypothetical protein
MSTPDPQLVRALHAVIAGSVATHEAVAERLGINPTDLRCLGLATTEPGLTPTRLAELAGLTTGAITGVLDRLESAGFLRREPDPADRRRLRLQLLPDRLGELGDYYKPLIGRAVDLASDSTPASEGGLATYLDRLAASLQQEAARLRVASRGGMVGDTYTSPVGGVARGRLVFASGAPRLAFGGSALGQQVRVVAETAASRLQLRAGKPSDELVRATFDGPAPDVRTANGVVTIRYSRRLLDPRARLAVLELNPALAWSIEVDGGITDLDADLRAVRLAGFDVRGGANHLRVRLGRPDGTVRLVLGGGSSDARFDRPRGTPVAVQVRGGVSHFRLDGSRGRSVGGARRIESDDYGSAPDRYEIEVGGATSGLTVSEA